MSSRASRPPLSASTGKPRRKRRAGEGVSGEFDEVLTRSGIRCTQQRRLVYEALMERRDHPTAQDLFLHLKAREPSISLATVYNCLETLTNTGLVRHVNLDRAPSRYCQNTQPHGHFFCDTCGSVADVPLKSRLDGLWELPAGTVVTQAEVNLRGYCADCAKSHATSDPKPLS